MDNGSKTSTLSTTRTLTRPLAYLVVILVVLLVGLLWARAAVRPADYQLSIFQFGSVAFFETSNLYYYLHLFTFVPVFLLSFDRRVHFYTRWPALLPAIAIVGAFFILWDVFFTYLHVWGFNDTYFAGTTFLHLPIEEWLFFFTVPYACVFIYACLNYYLPKDYLAPYERYITPGLALLLFVLGLLNWDQLYTATTFLLTASFLFYHWCFIPNTYRSRFYLAYLVSIIPFLIVNGVLTGGFTEQPVVMYNPLDNFGIRIGSVPIEDTVYSLLMLIGVTTFMEHFEK
ncbi:MAG: lycopene cyclase domain-containing protein [Bacteroidota bacterium]